MTEFRSKALIALGGNLPSDVGSPQETLSAAISRLSEYQIDVRAISRFFATPCFPVGAGPDFVNAAIAVAYDGTPAQLLAHLHTVEASLLRKRDQRWGVRTVDLDLLAVNQMILPDVAGFQSWLDLPMDQQTQVAPDELILPHPRIQDRAFVLVPLCDIAPNWRHPVLGRTVSDLCAALPVDEINAVKPI
ncbi:2-amino-4-hydroxy-6-hydroxymethyldihydropteridine diphosphokinase [Aliisedimentitalea scapharcae]|uniref:2-amino-4-hydroxy-6-hydroxymethyldihydropteridine pyrophosphokinase n=1 Tax=Aliisedimentitalea scapharcae TaxID=1524259 RepID=A0ABZ2XV86_9RHOB